MQRVNERLFWGTTSLSLVLLAALVSSATPTSVKPQPLEAQPVKPVPTKMTTVQTAVEQIPQVSLPTSPELVEPINTTVPLGTGVVFAWKAFAGAVRYKLKVATAASMSPQVYLSPFETDKTYYNVTSTSLKTGMTYHWQVAAILTSGSTTPFGPTTPASFAVAVPAASGPPPGNSDLTMTSCSFSPQTITQGDVLSMKVTWKNIGSGPALVPKGATEWMMRSVGGGVNVTADYSLAAGGEKFGGLNVTRDVGMLAPGTYTYQATVDPGNKVGETNENNNTVSCQVTIQARTKFPDLVITNLALDPPSPTSTSSFKLNVTVKNQGSDLARLFQGFDVVSGDPYAAKAAEPYETTLAAGASKTYSINPTTAGTVPGTRTWTIVVDQYNKVPESDENNNQKTISVTVK